MLDEARSEVVDDVGRDMVEDALRQRLGLDEDLEVGDGQTTVGKELPPPLGEGDEK